MYIRKYNGSIEDLTALHRDITDLLKKEEYNSVAYILNSFTDKDDIGVIKIALVVTKAFKEDYSIKEPRRRLVMIYARIVEKLSK